jgi:monothiol glutaredoxin
VHALKRLLDEKAITVIDVRPASERAIAPFAGAEVLDADSHERLVKLPKDTPLAFLCHHGQGFRVVHNVAGGIEAWSSEIDKDVPRY